MERPLPAATQLEALPRSSSICYRGEGLPPLPALPGGLLPPLSRRSALPRLVGVKAPTLPGVPWLPTDAVSSSVPAASLPPSVLGGRLPL